MGTSYVLAHSASPGEKREPGRRTIYLYLISNQCKPKYSLSGPRAAAKSDVVRKNEGSPSTTALCGANLERTILESDSLVEPRRRIRLCRVTLWRFLAGPCEWRLQQRCRSAADASGCYNGAGWRVLANWPCYRHCKHLHESGANRRLLCGRDGLWTRTGVYNCHMQTRERTLTHIVHRVISLRVRVARMMEHYGSFDMALPLQN